jgi:CO/xanthine dehydrogenase Mo-binding subunit
MKAEYKTIGQNIPKVGIEKRLRGAPIFSADLALDNPLILRVLRSTQAHAYVRRIDYEKALGIKGVVRIFTSKDIPGENLTGIINKDQPLLAADKVRSIGEPVALVAAETEAAADQALGAIEVTYEALPAVFSPAEALAPGAPKIHEKGNLLFTRFLKKGKVGEAFARCEAIVEKTYHTHRIEHSYLEPDAGAGYVDYDDTLVIFASTQNPHYDLKEVVGLLGLEEEQVRIVQAATGGGFGSKLDLNMQGFIGLALYHLKKPVRMVYTREEAYLATAKRHPLEMKIKTGADRNGKLLAMPVIPAPMHLTAFRSHLERPFMPLGPMKLKPRRLKAVVCTPTIRLVARCGASGPHRWPLRMNLRWISWPGSSTWIRLKSGGSMP